MGVALVALAVGGIGNALAAPVADDGTAFLQAVGYTPARAGAMVLAGALVGLLPLVLTPVMTIRRVVGWWCVLLAAGLVVAALPHVPRVDPALTSRSLSEAVDFVLMFAGAMAAVWLKARVLADWTLFGFPSATGLRPALSRPSVLLISVWLFGSVAAMVAAASGGPWLTWAASFLLLNVGVGFLVGLVDAVRLFVMRRTHRYLNLHMFVLLVMVFIAASGGGDMLAPAGDGVRFDGILFGVSLFAGGAAGMHAAVHLFPARIPPPARS